MIPELKATLCDFNEMQTYWNGFIDLQMKLKRGATEAFTSKSFFPYGSSAIDCTDIIQNTIKNAIKNPKIKISNPSKIIFFKVETDIANITKFTVEIENHLSQVFKFYIENGKAKFFPFSPLNYK